MQDIFIQSKVVDIFSEIQDGGHRHLGFSVCEFGHSGVLVQIWFKYLL